MSFSLRPVTACFVFACLQVANSTVTAKPLTQVSIDAGPVQGMTLAEPGVSAFLGIPYAAPPVGALRWREPQPVPPWTGVFKADHFGPRAMQKPIYADMVFRDAGPSEDCLYLNVWTPATSANAHLPVMVWIHGGGFRAGGSSEPRQDGAHLAAKGVVVVSMNYRLGIFGLFAHPELSAESGKGSGNYGMMDQAESLRWVQRNIAAFGGDPKNVTIFGESAGSFSVSLLMASAQTKALFHRAILESGAATAPQRMKPAVHPLAEAEQKGSAYATTLKAESLAALRAIPAAALLDAADCSYSMAFTVDGRFLSEEPTATFIAGRQARVPLLAGWNADEVRVYQSFGSQRSTAKEFTEIVQKNYGADAERVLKLYPATTDAEAVVSKGDLADDAFIVANTWYCADLQARTARVPVYVFQFDRQVPILPGTVVNGAAATSADTGATHASEIRYVFHAFSAEPGVGWQPEDERLSDAMENYWANFARTGNPNGKPLAKWPRFDKGRNYPIMHLDTTPHAEPQAHRDRYLFWASAPNP